MRRSAEKVSRRARARLGPSLMVTSDVATHRSIVSTQHARHAEVRRPARRAHNHHAKDHIHANLTRQMHFHATHHAALPPDPDAVERPQSGHSPRLLSKRADKAQGQRGGGIGLHAKRRGICASAIVRAGERAHHSQPIPTQLGPWEPFAIERVSPTECCRR